MHDALSKLEEYSSHVYKYLLCLTDSEDMAEELTQETMYKAILNINSLRDINKIEMWLCKIARNLWLQELKNRSKYKTVGEEIFNEIDSSQNIEEDFINKDMSMEVLDKVKDLEYPGKEVLFLRIKENMKFKDIGKIYGKSENWARVTYFRAKNKVREEVINDEEGTRV